MKTKILKEAEIEWGLRVGPKSNQREQTRVLLSILSKAIDQTREETIRDVREKMRSVEVKYTGDPFADNMIDNTIIDYYNKLKSIIN